MSTLGVWVPAEPAPYTAANRRRAQQEVLKQRAEEERKRHQQIESRAIIAETDKADSKHYQSDIYVSSPVCHFQPRLDANNKFQDTSNNRNKSHSHTGLRGALSSLFHRKHDKKDEDADTVR